MMNILIAGDLYVDERFQDTTLIDQSIIGLFSRSDLNILNQEAPVTENIDKNRIVKTGPHLRTSVQTTIPLLDSMGINLVTLANNHILDYGEIGLNETIYHCQNNGISTVGAGSNLIEARKNFRTILDEKKISIINIAENEWANASFNSAGANPMDIIENVKQIKKEKQISDKVILIIHGGHEYYNLPSPRIVNLYRFYADSGADLIVGHHTHCISGYEIYKDVPIYYSLGNFLFTTKAKKPKDWYTGLILEVNIDVNGVLNTNLHVVRQDPASSCLRLSNPEEAEMIFNRISNYNSIISNEDKLNESWNKFVDQNYKDYLKIMSPISFIGNRYFRALLNKLKISKLFLSETGLALKLNLLRCESLNDLSKEVIKRYISSR